MSEKEHLNKTKGEVAMSYFQQAISEEDPEKRFIQITNGIKTISTAMPYKKRFREFEREKDLIFHLIVLEIFNKKPIQLMIETIIEKLDEFPGFIPSFCQGFFEIAKCPESQLTKTGVEVKLTVPPYLTKYVNTTYTGDLNRDILKYMAYIKEIGLGYLKKFVLGRSKAIIAYDMSIDILKIIYEFVNNTEIEGLVTKTCEVLKEICADETAIKLIKDSKVAIDMVNASKNSESTVRRVVANSPKKIRKTLRASKIPRSSTINMINAKVDQPESLQSKPLLAMMRKRSPTIQEVLSREGSSEEEDSRADESDESIGDFDKSGEINENVKEQERQQEAFELWLVNTETFSILEDESVLQFFNSSKNTRLFLKMIVDPMEHECSGAYYNLYEVITSKMAKFEPGVVGSFFKSIKSLEAVNGASARGSRQKSELINMYRAFMCKQLLLNDYNWTHITMIFPHFISEFFNKISQCLSYPAPKVNTFIVLELTKIFLKRDPEQTLMNIIQFNIPFVLLWNVEYQNIRDFLVDIINVPLNPFKLSPSNIGRLCKYFKYTDFFIDYINIMVDKTYEMDPQKPGAAYKPQQLNSVYEHNNKVVAHIMSRSSKVKKNLTVCAVDTKKRRKSLEIDPYTLREELNKATGDIDKILGCINNKEAMSPARSSAAHNSSYDDESPIDSPVLRRIDLDRPNSSTSNSRIGRMYPSLLESLKKKEELKAKEKAAMTGAHKDRRYRNPHKTPKTGSNSALTDEKHEGRPNSRQSKASMSEELSQFTSLLAIKDNSSEKAVKKPDTLTHFRKNKQEQPTPLSADIILKLIHPDVKRDIYLNHYQNVNAPFTQSIANISALPSRALNKSGSMPHLNLLRRSIQDKSETLSVTQEKPFTPRTIKNNEVQALPLAAGLLDIIQFYFDHYKNTRLMGVAKIESTAGLKLLQCVQGGQGSEFFKLLLKSYVFKTNYTPDQGDSSAATCGRIVNYILDHLYVNEALKDVATGIHRECCRNINHIAKLLIDSISWKSANKPRVFLQNYMVHEVFGSNRLLLLTTMSLMIKNDAQRDYVVLDKIPDMFWHVMIYWLIELKHQNMFQNVSLGIYKIVFKHASEEVILQILAKANMLGQLHVAYKDISQMKECAKILRAEDFVFTLKQLLTEVDDLYKNRTNLQRVILFLSNLGSWKDLKTALLPPEEVVPVASITVSAKKKGRASSINAAAHRGSRQSIADLNSTLNANTEIKPQSPGKTASLRKMSEKKGVSLALIDISKTAKVRAEVDGSKLIKEETNKEAKTNTSILKKSVILPSLPMASKTNSRSQTNIKVRGESPVKFW